MATRYGSTLVGVFESHDDAMKAVDDLHRAGLTDERIRVAEHETGGLTGALQSLLGDTDINALTDMGIPEDDARYYERQLEAGHPLVVVRADGHYDDAARVLREYGARLP